MKTHELKTDPAPFDAVARGEKTHEIRYNDRDFQVGDKLILKRTAHTSEEMKGGSPLLYTGDEISCFVTHVQEGYGLLPGWAILSIERDITHITKSMVDAGAAPVYGGENG